VVRHLRPGDSDSHRLVQASAQRWFAASAAPKDLGFNARYHSPSMAPAAGNVSLAAFPLPGEQFFPAKADGPAGARIGNAVHAYLAALPSLRSADDRRRAIVAERCMAALGVTGLVPASVIVAAGQRLTAWAESIHPQATWHTEVPVSAPRAAGGQWVGSVDLLLELPSGGLVVVDHKSAPVRRDDCAAKAAGYAGQLLAYAEALGLASGMVKEMWVHFPLACTMVRLDRPA
jgi:ATP-dependent helicase/nuclease subunit A